MSQGPEHGGRVVLELEAGQGGRVVYRVTLLVREAQWSSRITLQVEDGAIEMEPLPAETPPWLIDAARAFVRTLWSARRGQPDATWPRRVVRWRAHQS